uniref:Uncharacterized protein n=1 Tax=Physcomitrium patens TaxID=3218 RepID=A0A2K1ICE8_PHYPA|nr:hypothetical protein PHYPA_030434 [Physcomitrium patens]
MKQNRADHSVAEFKHMRSGIGPLSRETIAASLSMSAPTLPKSCHHDDDRSRPRCLLLLFGYFLPLWSLPSQSIAIYVRSPVPSSLPSLESCRHLSSLALGFLRGEEHEGMAETSHQEQAWAVRDPGQAAGVEWREEEGP